MRPVSLQPWRRGVMVVECDQEVPESGIDWLRGFDGIRKVTILE